MRKCFPAMRFVLVLLAALAGLLAVTGTAAAKGHGTKHKKCKAGKVAVTINGRAKCTPLRKALPKPKATDQNLATVQQALTMDPKGLTRHGRRVPSARKLLGAKGLKKLEGAVSKGLKLAEKLKSKSAKASALSSVSSPFATASGGCGVAGAKSLGGKFQGNGFQTEVDLENGQVSMGVDGGANGVRVQLDLDLCEKGGLKLPSCPDAEGRLEGSDSNQIGMSLKVFQGSQLVLGEGFNAKATTTIEPVQVGDDAKLQYFEIDHTYSQSSTNNGISIHFNYHGHARVTFPGGNYDPTNTDVDARASVAGVDDSEQELREAEFDLSFEAKPKADQIFAAEVDKVIKALESAEKNWMTPNKCAQMTFKPDSKSLKPLKKDKQDTFDAEVKSADGGKPESGTWEMLKQANATFTPTTAHSNPAKFNYTVKKVGNEIFIETKLKVVSAAGVAEKDWIQPTEPDLINHITGTFTVRIEANGSIEQWNGEATYDRFVPGLSGATGAYALASGTATVVVSGYWGGGGTTCTWEGTKTYPIEPENAVTVVEVNPGSFEAPYEYNIEATVRHGNPSGIKVNGCEGVDEWEADMQMDFYTEPQVSDDGISYHGLTSETVEPGYIVEQTWDFEGTK